MMPVQSRRQGDDLLVDNVDLKRAARNLLNKTQAPGWTPPSDLNQAMELMATCFGYANLLAANKQAGQTLVVRDHWANRRALRAPHVLVYVADTRFDEASHARVLKRASRSVAGEPPLVLDMSNFDSITELRQFRKLDKPAAVVCDNIELSVNSRASSELMHVMVNHPDVEFRLLFGSEGEAVAFFQTWVYQDNSPAISTFTVVDDERHSRIVQLSYVSADNNRPRSLVAYPPEFHALLRASRSPDTTVPGESAEQPMTERAMTARSEGRQMIRMGQNIEDLAATRVAFKPPVTGGEASSAARSNTLSPAPDTFPKDCGPAFDQRWRNMASEGLYLCLSAATSPGSVAAIIGRPGTGKTLLVNAMAKSMDGAIVDFRLKTWQEDFDRVRRSPPGLIFIEELYYHSDATELEVATFAANAKSTRTVFVFQRTEDFEKAILQRRNGAGKLLFSSAQVLDLDTMTVKTLHVSKELTMPSPATTPADLDVRTNPLRVRVSFDAVGDNYATELLPSANLKPSEFSFTDEHPLLSVELAIIKSLPNGEEEVEDKLVLSPKEWSSFREGVDLKVFHRECTESGYTSIARAIELAARRQEAAPAPRRNRPR